MAKWACRLDDFGFGFEASNQGTSSMPIRVAYTGGAMTGGFCR